MRVHSLHSYPVKGSYRLDHDGAEVERDGLVGDRSWLVIDADGELVDQIRVSRIGQIRAVPAGAGLALSAKDMPELTIDGPGPVADEWFSQALGRPVRLVRRDGPVPNGLLLTTTASLDAVNGWLLEPGSPEGPVPMTRFRPNVVVAGADAWAEDGWIGRRLRIGEVWFRVTYACERCVIVTIDQETGERGHEPLRVLGRHRNIGQRLLFGVYLTPESTGRMTVGDPVSLT